MAHQHSDTKSQSAKHHYESFSNSISHPYHGSPLPSMPSAPMVAEAAITTTEITTSDMLYFQQTTTSTLCKEHRAEALPTGFFGWIRGLLFFERELTSQQLINVKQRGTTTPTSLPTLWGRLWKLDCVQHGDNENSEVDNTGQDKQTSTDPSSSSCIQSETQGNESAAARRITKIGLDHYLLLRFLWMMLVISAMISIPALFVLVPLYTVAQSGENPEPPGAVSPSRIEKMYIGNVTNNDRLWATVIGTAIATALIVLWVWSELMTYLKLREIYLVRTGSRYSSRTVLLQHIPSDYRSVKALQQLFSAAPGGVQHVYLVRDNATLEKAVQHRQVVLEKLEEAESKYMEAISRASALVCTTALTMRSRSWLGRCIDQFKRCLGQSASGTSSTVLGGTSEEEFVGPLKMYQLDDVPKVSLADLSDPGTSANASSLAFTTRKEGVSGGDTSSSLTGLKWYQKPRRPRHYVGLPLISKRKDSIRYFRGELCRLNKVIAQAYEEQAGDMASDLQNAQMQPATTGDTIALSTEASQVGVLPSAFILMKTHAGARFVASGMIADDKIPLDSRTLGITPRDIEWRTLSQNRSRSWHILSRAIVLVIGIALLVGCGRVVVAISSMTVFDGWTRVSQPEALKPAEPKIYLRQGVLAPLLITMLMSLSSWIVNGLCQYWGYVSKTQMELLVLRSTFVFLMINMVLVHPIQSLSLSWQERTIVETENLSSFLVHAIPSYSSYAFGYILMSGLFIPLCQLLQPRRLWATLPTITMWSILGPLSWRKMTRSQSKSGKHTQRSNPSRATEEATASTPTPGSADSGFGSAFNSTPSQTPRQAHTLRRPPFFDLQTLYPQLIILFMLSLALFPLAPILFLLWVAVMVGTNLCYRYLVLQVVTTKSQSGGQHFKQALMLVLFPSAIAPPLILAIYLGTRGAWIQCGFTIFLALALIVIRVIVEIQFRKREGMMLRRVEKQHEYLKIPQEDSEHPRESMAVTSSRSSARGVTTALSFSDTLGSTAISPGSEVQRNSVGPISAASFNDPDDDSSPPSCYGRSRTTRAQRPTTIFGQVRSSIASSMSPRKGGFRPKSVPVFDLERHGNDIAGVDSRDRQDRHGATITSLEQDSQNSANNQSIVRNNDHSTFGTGHDLSSLWNDHSTSISAGNHRMSVFSANEKDEEEREAKYREIVKALRRASSLVSKPTSEMFATEDYVWDANMSNAYQHHQQQRGDRDLPGTTTPQASKLKYRVSMPASAVSRTRLFQNNPYLMRQTEGLPDRLSRLSTCPSESSTSLSIGSGPGQVRGGAPSLPMLLIHRETAVAAKEKNRVRNMYLNPILQEAKSRVIVWLPSQTEISFWGGKYCRDGTTEVFARCRYHTALTGKGGNHATASTENNCDRSAFGMSTTTLGCHQLDSIQPQQPQQGGNTLQCTCQLFREVAKTVTDAVALADQEIRDLRIVGLSVWLDSRHVIWGQDNEEDGRLGDRYMISMATSGILTDGSFGEASNGASGGEVQKHVGDGLLSLSEPEAKGGEEGENAQLRLGQGAPGIIGGSMGVITKRPIGHYGRFVGNGEEDDIVRG
ncbi:hypothetical protein BGX31_011599 [Mortierella sp. GBA43]|nr:hypothetical protein BGX31_011599 [Mortierella sp. GBA43]